MARDYIDIGPTPAEEECAQVGQPDYMHRARSECNRFIELLRRTLGPEPQGARLAVKSNPHDFGTYLEVVCYFDTDNEEAEKYAYRCEREAPARWDAAPADGAQPDRVCDSCRSAAEDNGVPGDLQGQLMAELGSDLEDHLCDQVEDPNLGFRCLCGCRRVRGGRDA